MALIKGLERRTVGGMDTHKVCMSRRSWTNRIAFWELVVSQDYRQMLAWMRSLGDLQRIGVELTGGYGG